MNTNNNLSLYIKRVELHHTQEYISKVFKDFGCVEEVTFIPKSNDNGQKYNGAIIKFEKWNFNNKVEELWKKLKEKDDSTFKIYHNNKYFWVVSEHKIKVSETKQTELINDKDYQNITTEDALNIINDLKLKLLLLESTLQKKESFCMKIEEERIHTWKNSKQTEFQLDDRDVQIMWKDNEIEELKKENNNLLEQINKFNK